jgi:hypothetical protein
MPSVTNLKSLEVVGVCRSEKDNLGSPLPSPTHSVPTWTLASRLQPSERAAFAVSSRLLASIVTESLLRAYYIPIHSDEARGICVVLSTHTTEEHPVLARSFRPADIFAIIPLHQEPVFSGKFEKHGRPIWLLDPLDMVPCIFELSTREVGLDECVCLDLLDSYLSYLLIRDSPPFKRPFSLV